MAQGIAAGHVVKEYLEDPLEFNSRILHAAMDFVEKPRAWDRLFNTGSIAEVYWFRAGIRGITWSQH